LDVTPSTEQWVKHADKNRDVAQRLAEEPAFSTGVCLWSRICVESYLKAVLIENDQPARKNLHNVATLLERSTDSLVELTIAEPGIVRLAKLGNIGYPSAERSPKYFDRAAVDALATMEVVRGIVRKYVGMAV
jgi:HEPN domain-containing protein